MKQFRSLKGAGEEGLQKHVGRKIQGLKGTEGDIRGSEWDLWA